MVKYSDDTEYEQIDLATMYELKDARLVKAQIVEIDRVNNCAEITLSDTCSDLTGKDLSAVPFFYHCDNSTGTIEDLERGHLAFSVDDYVYCIWVPATDALAERFYIIGHHDLRGIGWCRNEILYLKTAEQTDPDSGYVYCLFDATAGRLLDLDLFTNVDDGSPVKPASAIGLGSTEVDDWVDYNFEDVTPTVTVPYYTNTDAYADIGATSVTENITGETAYTGYAGFNISSIPQDCSLLENPGNGLYTVTASRPISTTSGLVEGTNDVYIRRTSPFVAQLTDYDCRASWGDFEGVVTTTYSSTNDFRDKFSLIDPGTLDEISFGCSFSDIFSVETYSNLSSSGDLVAETYTAQSIIVNTHFSGFEQLNKTYTFTAASTTVFSNSAEFAPWHFVGDYVRESGTGTVLVGGQQAYIGKRFVVPDVMGPSRPVFVGEFAAYCITGMSLHMEEYTNTDPNLTRLDKVPQGLIAYAPADTFMYHGGLHGSQQRARTINGNLTYCSREVKVFIAPFAFVAPFYGDFGGDGSETVQTCFANTDPELSTALGEALQDTFDAFLTHVNTLGFDIDEYNDFYRYTVKPGIATTRIIKRKTL